MTQIWMDGFDGYANNADLTFRYSTSQPQISTTAGRFGGGCYQATQNNSWLAAPVEGNGNNVWAGFAFQPTENTNLYDVIGFTSTAAPECVLAYNWTTSTFSLYNVNVAAPIAIGSTVILSSSEYSWIDVFFELATTAGGTITVFVNNVEVMNVSGVQTAFNGVTALSLVSLSGSTANSGQGVHHAHFGNYDDFCLRSPGGSFNTGRQGDSRITTSVPSSDAGPNDATPSSGSVHYAMVNEAQWSSANSLTFVNTSGQTEAFGITPLPVVPTAVYAVQALSFADKTDAGAATFSQNVKSSTSTTTGGTQNLTQSFSAYATIFEDDPATSAAWLPAAVDDLIVIYEVQ